ncbi:patatin-like phospholipase family protein [Methylibium rhizosphaerae]|uniref:patatin-like phospholipase family protein n=1 Tax=Methylibium rhizosphaerae TaxID=2570323 RepID=UPI00112AB597|nr:patatin-like phospholipase family protein [Methylibium rhizosphaerae]
MDAIVLLQGGGALGAFTAGAWKFLAPRLAERGIRLAAVAGTSIGAIQAALIARHHAAPDLGAAAVESLWRDHIATPSLPFLGPWSALSSHARSWNGLLTSLMAGTRALHRANPWHWHPAALMQLLQTPWLDRSPMEQTLRDLVPGYRSEPGQAPLLGVAAVDVLDGSLKLFDSDSETIGPEHLLASAAVPGLYEPCELRGRLYWDGDVTRDSLVPPLLERLAASGRRGKEPPLWIAIEQRIAQVSEPPQSTLAMTLRMLDLTQHGKLARHAGPRAGAGPVMRVVRTPLENDPVSRELDYSPERIAELFAQGERGAQRAWEGWCERNTPEVALNLPGP